MRKVLRMLQPRALRARLTRCPLCGPTLLVRIADSEIGIRCVRCRGSAIHLSIMLTLSREVPDLAERECYELSSRGPLVRYLRARGAGKITLSEFFEDTPPGQHKNGIRCENVEQLTFPDASFDLVTCTEVFEHVADDLAGFREIRRVLRPGGDFVFTVPFDNPGPTVERARLENGQLTHLLPPEYHGDRLRGQGRVLVYRDYGPDIVTRLREAGFSEDRLLIPEAHPSPWGHIRPVVVARS